MMRLSAEVGRHDGEILSLGQEELPGVISPLALAGG